MKIVGLYRAWRIKTLTAKIQKVELDIEFYEDDRRNIRKKYGDYDYNSPWPELIDKYYQNDIKTEVELWDKLDSLRSKLHKLQMLVGI